MIEGINHRNFMFLNAFFNKETSSKGETESAGFQHRFTSYKDFPKADPPMSEEDFEKAIFELGKKEYANGELEKGLPSNERKRLMLSYLSVVSPDRDKIITKSLNSIPFRLRGAQLGYSEFFSNKETVAIYSPNVGWSQVITKAEGARTSQFYSFYMAGITEAMNAEKGGANTQLSAAGIAIDTKA